MNKKIRAIASLTGASLVIISLGVGLGVGLSNTKNTQTAQKQDKSTNLPNTIFNHNSDLTTTNTTADLIFQSTKQKQYWTVANITATPKQSISTAISTAIAIKHFVPSYVPSFLATQTSNLTPIYWYEVIKDNNNYKLDTFINEGNTLNYTVQTPPTASTLYFVASTTQYDLKDDPSIQVSTIPSFSNLITVTNYATTYNSILQTDFTNLEKITITNAILQELATNSNVSYNVKLGFANYLNNLQDLPNNLSLICQFIVFGPNGSNYYNLPIYFSNSNNQTLSGAIWKYNSTIQSQVLGSTPSTPSTGMFFMIRNSQGQEVAIYNDFLNVTNLNIVASSGLLISNNLSTSFNASSKTLTVSYSNNPYSLAWNTGLSNLTQLWELETTNGTIIKEGKITNSQTAGNQTLSIELGNITLPATAKLVLTNTSSSNNTLWYLPNYPNGVNSVSASISVNL